MITLPRITQVGTSGTEAKAAPLSCLLLLGDVQQGWRGKHICQTSEAASTQTEDKCLCKTVLPSTVEDNRCESERETVVEIISIYCQTNEH